MRGRTIKKSAFSSDHICRIIEQCVLGGVSEFEYEGLYLKFGGGKEAQPPVSQTSYPIERTESFIEETDHEKNNSEYLEEEELRVKEERLGMLLIEDPMEYERQISAGELMDDDGSEGPDQEA